jgi:hypothetical protein
MIFIILNICKLWVYKLKTCNPLTILLFQCEIWSLSPY